MVGSHEASLLRRGTASNGQPLTAQDREQLVKPYLPPPSKSTPKPKRLSVIPTSTTLNTLLTHLLHRLIFLLSQALFTLYIRLRQLLHALSDRLLAILYHHHRTPALIQRDVRKLSRLPRHLSIIVALDSPHRAEALAKLTDDVAEVAAWCACAGIPLLSVYEASGALKTHVPSLHRRTARAFRAYFPPGHFPGLRIRAPLGRAYEPPANVSGTLDDGNASGNNSLDVLLLSASDGRTTLVDLTKTLAEMAQRGKLAPSDVSAELIDAELSEASGGCGEPDLLIVMAKSRGAGWGIGGSGQGAGGTRKRGGRVGKSVYDDEADDNERNQAAGGDLWLRGYPPWQVRLTEIL